MGSLHLAKLLEQASRGVGAVGGRLASHAMGRRRVRVLRAEAAGDFVLGRRGARVPRAEVAGAFVLGQRGRLRRVVASRAEAAD